MSSILVSKRDLLSSTTERQLAGFRHDVFVKKLGWQLPSEAGDEHLERDQFDHAETVYVIRQDENGEVSGCARLLPTTEAYLLSEVFPNLFDADHLPRSELVWEISRLALSGATTRAELAEGLRDLLRAAVEFGLSNGVRRYISVSFVSMERLLRRMGIHAHRAGTPILIDNQLVVAFWVDLDPQTLTALGMNPLMLIH